MKPEVLSALLTALELECGQDVVKSEVMRRYGILAEPLLLPPSEMVIAITNDREHVALIALLTRIKEASHGRIPQLPKDHADSIIDEIFGELGENSYFLASISSFVEQSGDWMKSEDVEEDYVEKDKILDYVHLSLHGDGETSGEISIETDF